MWLPCHVPSSSSFQENKIKKKKSKIRKIKENKIKIVSIQMSMTENTIARTWKRLATKKGHLKETTTNVQTVKQGRNISDEKLKKLDMGS